MHNTIYTSSSASFEPQAIASETVYGKTESAARHDGTEQVYIQCKKLPRAKAPLPMFSAIGGILRLLDCDILPSLHLHMLHKEPNGRLGCANIADPPNKKDAQALGASMQRR